MIRITTLDTLAVSTLVLAALAVSGSPGAHACPLGEQARVTEPSLPWSMRGVSLRGLKQGKPYVPPPPALTVRALGGDAPALMRVLRRTRIACGSGRGEVTVAVFGGRAVATATGFDSITAACIERAIEGESFSRIDEAFAHLTVELK